MTRMTRNASLRLEREIATALAKSVRPGAKPRRPRGPKRSPREVLADRLKSLQHRMTDALGDDGWMETVPAELESWISVSDDLSDRDWLDAAYGQLLDASVLPEHAGAPPPSVRAWNEIFIATYLMNVDDGMNRQDAIDSARQNAHDSVDLASSEHDLVRTDPDLYAKYRRW